MLYRDNVALARVRNNARWPLFALCLAASFASFFVPIPWGDFCIGVAFICGFVASVIAPTAVLESVSFWPDFPDCAFIGFALLATAFVWARPDVPGLRHDWFVSPSGSQFARDLFATLSAWQSTGLGSATPQAGFHPLYLIEGLISEVAGTRAAITVVMVSSLGIAGYASRRVGQLAGLSAGCAFAAGMVYELSPFVYARLISGHISHLWGYAVVALMPLFATHASTPLRKPTIAAVMTLATAAIQPQYAVIAALMFSACAIALGRFAVAVIVPLGAALLSFPILVAAVSSAGDTYTLKHATLMWEATQSVPLAALIHQGGSQARYFESAGWLAVAAASFIGVAALLASGSRRTALGRAVMLCGACAAIVALGLNGPAASAIAFAFRSAGVSSLFRELYDVMPPFCLAIAISAPAAVKRRSWAALIGVAALLASSPLYDGLSAHLVPVSGNARVADAIAARPGDGCIAWLPGVYPMRTTDGGLGEGYDNYFRTAGDHRAIFAYQPIPAVAALYLATSVREAATRLHVLGCDAIGIDRRVESIGAVRAIGLQALFDRKPPSFREGGIEIATFGDATRVASPAVRLAMRQNVGDGKFSILSIDDPDNATAAQQILHVPVVWQPFEASIDSADPRDALVLGANQWAAIPAFAKVSATLPVVGINPVIVGRSNGTLVGATDAGTFDLPIRSGEKIALHGAVALVGLRSDVPGTDRIVAPSAGGHVSYRQLGMEYTICSHGNVDAIVLRENFDRGWQLKSSSGILEGVHFRADAWANGWLVHVNDGECLTASYVPESAVSLAEGVDSLLWIAGLGFLVGWPRRVRSRVAA